MSSLREEFIRAQLSSEHAKLVARIVPKEDVLRAREEGRTLLQRFRENFKEAFSRLTPEEQERIAREIQGHGLSRASRKALLREGLDTAYLIFLEPDGEALLRGLISKMKHGGVEVGHLLLHSGRIYFNRSRFMRKVRVRGSRLWKAFGPQNLTAPIRNSIKEGIIWSLERGGELLLRAGRRVKDLFTGKKRQAPFSPPMPTP